ncbi:MAG: WYL domain-containing protein [Bacteroidales bacterium]|nr:WYL domain-containing protein [Bacteroidales bacterium]
MKDQAKIERSIKLLLLLSGGFGYSIKAISEKLETSERTIYRYIETFRNIGLIIEKNRDGYWKIEKNSNHYKDLHELLQFSEEESYILQKAIHSIDDNNALKSNLISKLYSLYKSKRVIDTIIKKENSECISNITSAIENNKQIKLIDYKSANSNTISTRILEPIKFTPNFVAVWCYEAKNGANKLFKTSRIKKVEILNKRSEHVKKHKAGYIDCFRMSSNEKIQIQLELNIRARNLLIEEYPLAEKDIIEINENTFLFDSYVSNFDGVGRFILGLMNDITIKSPTELKKLLNNKIKVKVF